MDGNRPFHETGREGDPSGKRDELTGEPDGWQPDPDAGTFRTTFDSGTESAGMAVVSAVAAITNTDPKEMEPLHGVIDTEALNSFFRRGSDGQITFPYSGHVVVIRSDGVITVAPDAGG